jgi:glycosyltransferase involved in cell wall biosynthesis
MNIIFLTDHLKFSGGRWLLLEYAAFLKERGHQVTVLIQKERGELLGRLPTTTVPTFDARHIPPCDLIVATTPREAVDAWRSGRGKVIHFCQGFEVTDYEQRLDGTALPEHYRGAGWLTLLRKRWTWWRKLRRVDAAYRLPTHLIAVSAHLQRELEGRYGRRVHLCRNGVDLTTLRPDPDWQERPFATDRPMRVLNIGPLDVAYKGVPTTLAAVSRVRDSGLPVEFTRITPRPPPAEERPDGAYTLHVKLPREEFVRTMRGCDVYVSNSTEREGFGLPAMEALSCGLACVLSDIECYRAFAPGRGDFCIFVPPGDIEATAAALVELHRQSGSGRLAELRRRALEVSADFSHQAACATFERILNAIHTGKESDHD